MQHRQAAVSSLSSAQVLFTLLVKRHFQSQSGQANRLCEGSSCAMPNNIPSAVSMLPQNKQSAPSDIHRMVFKPEDSSEASLQESYDPSVLLRTPLRSLNSLDQCAKPDAGKRTLQHSHTGILALDSALRGVHVYKLCDGTFTRALPCTFGIEHMYFDLLAMPLPPSNPLSQIRARLRSVPFTASCRKVSSIVIL